MYETLSALAGRVGTPHARQLAAFAIRVAGMVCAAAPPTAMQRTVMGLSFPSPIGLAAGFDKSGALYRSLPGLGFGFAEIGTVVPHPEDGRSPGLAAVRDNLARYGAHHPIPLGASISMNRTSPLRDFAQDYLNCFERLWPHADYIALNLGMRSGPDLHRAEHRGILNGILAGIRRERWRLGTLASRHVPVVIKVDAARGDTDALLGCAGDHGLDGAILSTERLGDEAQGLRLLERHARALGASIPIVSVGGIETPQQARDRLNAGAALLQLYSGLVRHGPGLVMKINNKLHSHISTKQ